MVGVEVEVEVVVEVVVVVGVGVLVGVLVEVVVEVEVEVVVGVGVLVGVLVEVVVEVEVVLINKATGGVAIINIYMQKLHRHGEIILKQIKEIPKEAKLTEQNNSIIVGHSESGHHHVLSVVTDTIKMFEFEGKTYLDIPLEAKLKHQKTGQETHGTQTITPGLYERIIKRSYSYAEKVMRRVQD